MVQRGGPPETRDKLCKQKSLTFVMPYEMSFVLNFTIGEHHLPTGKTLKLTSLTHNLVPTKVDGFVSLNLLQLEGF